MPTLVKLGDTQRKRLLDYLETEYERAIREVYDPLQEKRNRWEDKYSGKVKPRRADWMSNIPMGLGATYTDATTARFLNTMMAYKPTYTVHPLRSSEWVTIAKSVELLFEYKIQREMQYYDTMRRTIFETCRLGTGAFLAPWVRQYDTLSYKKFGFIPATTQVPTIDGIVLQGLPLRQLVIPGGFSEVVELPWWARKLDWSPLDIEMRRADKELTPEDAASLLKFLGRADENAAAAQERAGEDTPTGYYAHIVETWLKYDLERRGEFGRYIVRWHPESRAILQVEKDDYPDWPLFMFRYGPRDYGIFGLGVMDMSDPYDDALYALVNLFIDNFKVATMQCVKGRKGASLRSDTDLYPGKLFLLNDPETDLIPFSMGTTFNLNPQILRMVMDLSERRTGISDYGLGRESPTVGSKATATATLALIQEGARRFDLTIRDIRQVLDNYGNYALKLMHRLLPREVPYMILGDRRGQSVEKWLQLPRQAPQYSIAMVSNLSNVTTNKETAKQDAQTVLALLTQFYGQMVPLTMQIDSPQTPPTLKATLTAIRQAAAEKFNATLEVFGESSPERYTDMFMSGVPPFSQEGAPVSPAPGMGAPSPTPGGVNPMLSMLMGGGGMTQPPMPAPSPEEPVE